MALNIQEARWVQGQSGWVQKISPSPEFDPQTVWLLASYCTMLLAHTTTTTKNNNSKKKKKDDDCGGNHEKSGMRFSQQ
jgi:hypothetical protein